MIRSDKDTPVMNENITGFLYPKPVKKKNLLEISEIALQFGYWLSGPLRVLLGFLGWIGNLLALIVFAQPHMRTCDINHILISKWVIINYLPTIAKNSAYF